MKKGTFTPMEKRKNRDLTKFGSPLPIRSSARKKEISLSLILSKILFPTPTSDENKLNLL